MSPATEEAASGEGFTQSNRSSLAIRLEYASSPTMSRHGITLTASATFSALADANAAPRSTQVPVLLGSSVLYYAVHARGSPFRVTAHHKPIKKYQISGDAVSLMTAGIQGSFSLRVRDDYSNPIVNLPEVFMVSAAYPKYPSILSGALLNGSNGSTLFLPYDSPTPFNVLANHSVFVGGQNRVIRSSESSVYPHAIARGQNQRHMLIRLASPLPFLPRAGDPFDIRLLQDLPTRYGPVTQTKTHFKASLTVTRASAMTLFAQAARVGGLSASYYSNFDMHGPPSLSRTDTAIDFSGASSDEDEWPGANGMNTSSPKRSFSVKWRGFVLPHYLQTYTFRTTIQDYLGTSRHERVRLWINNQEVISQWSSLSSAQPSGTFEFPRHAAKQHYREQPFLIELHFKDAEAGGRRFQLAWETSEYARMHSLSPIHITRLFTPMELDAR